MGTNDLISVLMGEYGSVFSTIEMWACINALADIIRQYQPDFKLWDIENKIYNEQKEKNK